MRILLLVSAFNGLTQRVWCHLKEQGHDVGVELAGAYATPEALTEAVDDAEPDLILCPFLKHRVPESVWGRRTTVIIHPGPAGDRGPSSLDHAILDARGRWGVTALSAVEKMDAGPVWHSQVFDVPAGIAKSALYNGPVADAAMVCVDKVLAMVAAGEEPSETWTGTSVPSTGELPLLRREAFRIDWTRSAEEIARRVAAADGAPGAPATIQGTDYCVYDAVADPLDNVAAPGTVVGHDTEAVAIACGSGTLWVGYAATLADNKRGPKVPASWVIDSAGTSFRFLPRTQSEVSYDRIGDVGFLTLRSYNGAWHTEQCHRFSVALQKALIEDTRVLVVRGTEHAFSNGIHLGVIDAAEVPAAEAWDNIRAIDGFCRTLAEADQVTVAAITASAGAGGVMAALCADVTVARDGVVLNPYYDMGILGSELHTWGLASVVGELEARELLDAKLPISAGAAERIGMLTAVGPRDYGEFTRWLEELAGRYADTAAYDWALSRRLQRREGFMPLPYYEALELAEMARDFFEDRHGFAEKRKAFVTKAAASETPAKLRMQPRPA
ncbi:MAG: hypothetical protein J2O46_02605, partial [Nocardioides sp.]|nr:hypothetical protein [Nocardioides sp.]